MLETAYSIRVKVYNVLLPTPSSDKMKASLSVKLALAEAAVGGVTTRANSYRAELRVHYLCQDKIDSVVIRHQYTRLWELDVGDSLVWVDLAAGKKTTRAQSVKYGTGELRADFWRVTWTTADGHMQCSTRSEKMHNLVQADSQSPSVIVIHAGGVTFNSPSGSSFTNAVCTCDYSGIFHFAGHWSGADVCTCNAGNSCTRSWWNIL